jgi:hypothetical protein
MRRWGIFALVALVVSVGAWVIAQENDCPRNGEDFTLWTVENNRCSRAQELHVTVKVEYPTEFIRTEFAKEAILGYFDERKGQFWAMLNDSDLSELADWAAGANWTLEITPQLFQHSETVQSILFTEYENTGGAHPNTYFRTFTFNNNTQTVLGLADLFPATDAALKVIYPLVEKALIEALGADADAQWVADGTGLTVENYAHFVLTEDAITFYFAPYQVAAYAYGAQQVSIPLADLADVLDESVLE